MLYNWSLGTRLNMARQASPLFFGQKKKKKKGLEQLKSYCSWHLLLPFRTFTDATISPTMTNHTEQKQPADRKA